MLNQHCGGIRDCSRLTNGAKSIEERVLLLKSGYVREVKFNQGENVFHVNVEVLSSYKRKSYRKDMILKKQIVKF